MKFEISYGKALKIPDSKELLMELLHKRGFSFPQSAEERPRIPADIYDHPPANLGEILNQLTAYFEYVSSTLALVKTLETNLKESMEHAQSEAYMNNHVGTVEERKIKAKLDPVVVELKEKWLTAKSEADLIEQAIYTPVKRDLATISRLISLKGIEMGADKRWASVASIDEAIDKLR